MLFGAMWFAGACPAFGQSGPFFSWTNFVGEAGNYGSDDGTGTAARFYEPYGVALDAGGTLYVADTHNCTIRKVNSAGQVTTFAGMAGAYGSDDGVGTGARFNSPAGITTDAGGNLFVADFGNHTIRKINSAGVVTTLAGLAGSPGSANGTGSAARFNQPYSVAANSSGIVYVADRINHTIRKITQSGEVTTLAGLTGSPGSANGTGSAARFYWPSGVAVDNVGRVLVADWGNSTIRRITPAGVVSTLAGYPAGLGGRGTNDGVGSVARFNEPWGVTTDFQGNLYVSDNKNHTIRKVTSDGVVSTVGSVAGQTGQTDGFGSVARFNFPTGLAIDQAGFLYLADTYNQRISKGTPIYPLITPFFFPGLVYLTWSDKFLGWELQTQTNVAGAGLSTEWVSLAESTLNTSFSIAMDPNSGSVFFRLYSDHAP